MKRNSIILDGHPQLLTIPQAAAYLKLSQSTLYKYNHRNLIPYYKPSLKLVLYKKEDLDAWLYNKRIPSTDELMNG